MDLRLLLSVVGRFKLLVIGGLVVGIALAVLSVARVDTGHGAPSIAYRTTEQWGTYTRVLLTAPPLSELGGNTAAAQASQASIQASLPGLATVYGSFVSSDAVRKMLFKQGHVGLLAGTPVKVDPYGGSAYLPILSIEAVSTSPERAQELAVASVPALAQYLKNLESQGTLPSSQRAVLSVLNGPTAPFLVRGHSLKLPMAVFVVVLFATIGLAFILENLRPRVRLVPSAEESAAEIPRGRVAS
jgi:hypothetical protein